MGRGRPGQAWSGRTGPLTCARWLARVSLRLLLESMAMDGRIDVTTLLFLVVAVVIFLKLRSVLGRRTGHEQGRYERYKAQQEAAQRNGKLAGPDKVVTLPGRARPTSSSSPPSLRAIAKPCETC